MKKFLLLLFVLVAMCGTAVAEDVTFDFTNNDYGLTRYSTGSTFIDNGTTITTGGVTIALNKKTGSNGWRLWTDGLRAYKSSDCSMNVSASREITSVKITQKIGTITAYTVNGGTSTTVNGDFTATTSGTNVNLSFTVSSNAAIYTVVVSLSEGSGPVETKTGLTLKYTPAEETLNLDDAFTAPVFSVTDGEGNEVADALQYITYSVEGDDVLSVNNGVISANTTTIGTAKITATLNNNDSYTGSPASYTLTVIDPSAVKYEDVGMGADDQTFKTFGSSYGEVKYGSPNTQVEYAARAMKGNNGIQINSSASGTSGAVGSGIISVKNPLGLDIDRVEMTTATECNGKIFLDVCNTPGSMSSSKVVAPTNVTNITGTFGLDNKSVTYNVTGSYKYLYIRSQGAQYITSLSVYYRSGNVTPIVETVADVTFEPGTESELYGEDAVTLSCDTKDAVIWYSINEENGPFTKYISPITFSEEDGYTIYAYATAEGMNDGNVTSANFYYYAEQPKAKCAKVTFKPGDGATLYGNQKVTLSCSTEGATIYIITDEDYIEYTEPISFTEDGKYTITAIASKEGYDDSEEASATYTYYAEKKATHYVLVNNTEEVKTGVNYVLAHNSVANSGDICQWVMGAQKGNAAKDNRNAITVTFEDNSIYALPAKASVFTLEESGNSDFPYQIAIDGGYLAASDTNNNNCVSVSTDANDAATFCNVSFTDDNVTITFNKQKNGTNFFLAAYYTGGGAGKPNSVSSPLFNCYVNAQRPVQLYREVATPNDPEISGVDIDDENKVNLNAGKATIKLTAPANHDLYYKHVVASDAAKAPALDHTGYTLAENGSVEIEVNKNSTLSYYTVADNVKSQTKSIEFHNDGTTSISEVGVDSGNNEEWYDLSGRRVAAPTKGVFIKKYGNTVTKHMM